MRNIKFGEISIGETARKHIADCLNSNWVTSGPKTKLFEKQLASLFNVPVAVATNCGTSAVQAMCMTLYDFGAKRGDEIICPALSFIATGSAILAAGFTPKFIDIDRQTLQINTDLIEPAITDRTAAIMPVCLMGKPYDVKKVRAIADKHNLRVIADCCESHGAKVDGKFVEEYADMCAYSFYSAHVSFAVQMGAVTTKEPAFEEALRSIRSHGRDSKSVYFDHKRLGYNLNPTDLHAAIGLEGLDMFKENFDIRKVNFWYMKAQLSPIHKYVYFVEQKPNEVNSPHAFSVVLKDPGYDIKGLEKALNEKGIETKRNFGCIPSHGAFKFMNIPKGTYPEAEFSGNQGIHWACHRYLLKDDMDLIIDIVLDHFGEKRIPSYG